MTTALHMETYSRMNRGLFLRLDARLRHMLERRRLRETLLALDDHLLRDIGLTRGDILAGRF